MFVEVMSGIAFLNPEELEAARKYITMRQLTAEEQIKMEQHVRSRLEPELVK